MRLGFEVEVLHETELLELLDVEVVGEVGVGYLISFVFRERLVGAEPALEGTLMDDVELAVVHEGDVGDDARLPKQIRLRVPGGQGFAELVDGDVNKPTDPMAILLLLRVAPLARFAPASLLARVAGGGGSTLLAAVDRFLRRERYAAGVTGACVRPPEAPPVALLDVPMELSEDLFFSAGM